MDLYAELGRLMDEIQPLIERGTSLERKAFLMRISAWLPIIRNAVKPAETPPPDSGGEKATTWWY